MLSKKKRWIFIITNIVLFSAVILFETAQIADISIKTATPLLFLPLLTAFAVFSTALPAAAMGMLCGAFLDSVSYGSYCFNTIALMVLSVLAYLIANNLFNKNLKSSIVLSIMISAIYFLALWAVFHTFNKTFEDSFGYLFRYAFPSAVYSAVFVIPFYFIYKKIND